jgi:hypothetical protein
MLFAKVVTVSGAVVEAEWELGGKVALSQGGRAVGEGTLRMGEVGSDAAWCRIEDCAARLGAADGSETAAAFEALEQQLAAGLSRQSVGDEADDETTLTDATATREARIEAAARLCRTADEEQAVEGDAPMTWQSSREQIGTVETMQQACDGYVTGADWQTFAPAY